ncbi:Bestrophin, RFP-TM, chloride channel-domain-containing protein [Ganoderma leucocontextum]|nr:Bestrophin, RFP-TM, chloride channel-domain-containing protein [Ganoderma leucocontextum]
MAEPTIAKPRSATGHMLLPAFDNNQNHSSIPVTSTKNLISWTFGRGTVIWRIWPAVLLHTVFAAVVVTVSLKTRFHFGIPNVLLTVLGVVIGFVISYRASSGYDRYYQGRTAWSDIARTSRAFSRLIWIHVPLKIAPAHIDASGKHPDTEVSIARRVMTEKRIALDLLEGFVVAVKHHLRGEMGIYYEDLYPFVKPLHNHAHHRHDSMFATNEPAVNGDTVTSPVRDFQPEAPLFALPNPHMLSRNALSAPAIHTRVSTSHTLIGSSSGKPAPDPAIPPINAYGTLPPPLRTTCSTPSLASLTSDGDGERRPLLPGAVPQGEVEARRGLLGSVAGGPNPAAGVSGVEADIDRSAGMDDDQGGIQRRWAGESLNGEPVCEEERMETLEQAHPHTARIRAAVQDTTDRLGITHSKHRPRVAGGGENLPLEILRTLSIWLSVLDERGVVSGPGLGGMYGCLAAFEDSLATLERILTTPLPFVYSVHIRTVWIYLFFLPFQLIDLFGYYAILGVCIAAFIYLGLIAAGEEIEQPFGYDENDLDLDFFCSAIVHADIERIKRISCPNVYLGSHHSNGHGGHGTTIPCAHAVAVDPQTTVDIAADDTFELKIPIGTHIVVDTRGGLGR